MRIIPPVPALSAGALVMFGLAAPVIAGAAIEPRAQSSPSWWLAWQVAPIAMLAAGVGVARVCLPVAAWPQRAAGAKRSGRAGAWLAVLVAATAALVGMPQAGPQTLPALVPAMAGPVQVAWGLLWVGAAAPLIEELYFRGALQPALRYAAGAWPAAVLSGVVFALAHGPADFWWKLAMGLAFAALAEVSGGVLLPIAAHAGWNAGMVAGSVWPAAGWVALAVGLGATAIRWRGREAANR